MTSWARVEYLCRRFRKTIGLDRLVVVQYTHPIVFWETRTAVGYPFLARRDMIYLRLASGAGLKMIPKGCIINIKALIPRPDDPDNDRVSETQQHD